MNLGSSGSSLSVAGTIVPAVLLMIAAVAVAVAYYRSSYAKATIDTLKESNAALTERNDQLDRDKDDLTKKLTAVEIERDNLREYVSGTAAINTLTETVKKNHRDVMNHLQVITRDYIRRRDD